MDIIGRRFLVEGRVQGVGFRAYARRAAVALSIGGQARNLVDGTVEVLAAGASAAMLAFEGDLGIGPISGRVDRVVVTEITVENISSKVFDIR